MGKIKSPATFQGFNMAIPIPRETNGNSNLPWIEKYRPSTLDEIRGNEDRIESLKRLTTKPSSFPHLLLSGPAGTGKTSAALAVAKEINATTEIMNASHERGIDIIKTKVTEYASTVSLDGKPYKVLIMDESDGLTKDAQNAMKEIMESNIRSCRMFLLANEIDGIIKPIRSRCSQFYFEPVPDEDVKFTLGNILENEGIEMEEEGGDLIVRRAMGDLRSAISMLQMICDGQQGTVTTSHVSDILQASQIDGVTEIIGEAVAGNFGNAKSMYIQRFKGYAGAQDFSEMVMRDLIQGKFTNIEIKVALNLPYLQMGGGRNDYLVAIGFLARLGESS